MTPYQLEQCEILRRIAERGKKEAERRIIHDFQTMKDRGYLDLFVHLLDEIKRLKESA